MKKITILLLTIATLLACDSDSNKSLNTGTGTGGSLARFIIFNDYLYTVDEESLNVFDISNPQSPMKVNDIPVGFGIETIFAYENNLFIGSQIGMYIYGLDDPSTPVQLSQATHLRACDPVVSNLRYTFVTLHSNVNCIGTLNQLEIYDTDDLSNPTLINVIPFDRPIGMGIYDNNILILSDLNKLRFLDVSDPLNPSEVHQIDINSNDLIVKGTALYVIGDTTLTQYTIDPTDITQTQELSQITY